jgi:hypothetical protein
VSRADHAADAAFASGTGHRDDGLLALAAAVAGRGKHDRQDGLFADGESW